MKRWRITGLALMAGIVLAGVAVTALLATSSGSRWLVQQAAARMPGTLHIGRVDGTLLGPLALRNIDYRFDGEAVALQELLIDWHPAALLYGNLDISALHAYGLQWTHASTQPATATPVNLPELHLPLRVYLHDVRISAIELQLGTQHIPITTVQLASSFAAGSMAIKALDITTRQGRLRLNGRLQPHGDYPLDSKLTWTATAQSNYPLSGTVALSGSIQDLQLGFALTDPFKIDGAARLRALLSGVPRIDLTGRWQQARWPLRGRAQLASTRGELKLRGTPDDYTANLFAVVAGPTVPQGTWQGTVQGDQQAVRWQSMRIDTMNGRVDSTGRFAWAPNLAWRAQLQGHALDPGVRWPAWPGRVSFDVISSGSLPAQAQLSDVQTTLHINALTGTLRGHALSGTGELAYHADTLRISALALASGSARLAANGSVGKDWRLDWSVSAPHLDDLLPQARGELTGHGNLRGPRRQPRVDAQLAGRGLGYGRQTVDTLQAQLAVDLADVQPSRVTLLATGVTLPNRPLGTLRVSATGRLRDHSIDIESHGNVWAAHARLDGAWDSRQWRGRVQRFDLRDTRPQQNLGTWILDAPAALRVMPAFGAPGSARSAELSRACWQAVQGPGRTCLAARWTPDDWRVDAQLTQTPLQPLNAWLPASLELQGTLDGSVSARGGGTRAPSAQLLLTPTPGTLIYHTAEDETLRAAYRQAQLQATLRDGTVTGTLNLSLSQQGEIHSDWRITPVDFAKPLGQARVQGRIQSDFTELGMLAAFLPATEETRGHLAIDLDVAGTLAQPLVTGRATLSDAGALVPQLGMRLEAMSLTAQATGGSHLTIDGTARSGKGQLHVRGTAELDAARGFPVQLDIKGDNFTVLNQPDVQALASPDLHVLLHGHELQVNGTLAVPEARVTVRKPPANAVPLSGDVVIVGTAPPAPSTWRIGAQIALSLGDKVYFQGFNVESRVTGKLDLTERPDRPTQAQGELRLVDGKYNAYGRQLDIIEGRLSFGGLLDNPRLYARAIRTVSNVTAGIRAVGALKDPEVTLFSEPAMDQGDVLSYLLIGQPLKQASGGERQMLQQAGTSLGLSGGLVVARQIGERLGLQEVQIAGSSSDASLVVGKYLSPKLYVTYGLGLFQPENRIRLRYQFNRWLTLQTDSGAQSGADLLYTKEYE